MLALVGLIIILLAPIASQLVRLALSRQREYLADASGAQLTRYPEGLASALEKMKKTGTTTTMKAAGAGMVTLGSRWQLPEEMVSRRPLFIVG